ncbi:Uncharacterized protein BM_BM7939 [Brugia malayi]|uniref:Bm7939 n=2 Tax=Brugia TaxID=6278 RepID=A0A0K0JU84_BRUMA|nr:Uncharacterized protein BM_BM7939 [Brugia malayi]CDQ05235.1 Bm7939 [Brugia malayi]VDN91725.1 unnamed protein product [Brugia pahangi]VIO97743.1 Uncharacterized protein BM_BM7939 [Brugia malayi]
MVEQCAECNLKAFLVSNVTEQVAHMKVFMEAEREDCDDAAATGSFPRGLCQRRCDAKFAGQLNT